MNELEENQQTVKKSGFGRGLIFGVIAGLSIAILAGVVLLNVFYPLKHGKIPSLRLILFP